jgi:peptidoglycan/LPS O-acetylase OafA/YrhL
MTVSSVSNEVALEPPVIEIAKPAAAPTKSFRIEELDGLRGLAALFAVTYHCLTGPRMWSHLAASFQRALEITPISIDTFFILSGFLIGGILLRAKDSPNYYKTFYIRRFHRILPLYYAWIGAYLIVFLTCQAGWGLNRPKGYAMPLVFGSYLIMVQNFFPAIAESTYMVAPTWTLAIEEHFYLVIPLCVRKLSKRGLAQGLVGAIAAAPMLRAFVFLIGKGGTWSRDLIAMSTPFRADALAMGVLLALVWTSAATRERIRQFSWLLPWVMLGATFFAGIAVHFDNAGIPVAAFIDEMIGRSVVELSCLALIIFVLARPSSSFCALLRTRFFLETGKISYCLYVVHWGMLWMVSRLIFHTRFGDRPWLDVASALIAVPLSYGLAMLSWRFFERPLVRRAHRYSY